MRIRALDVETTGLLPSDKVIEIGSADLVDGTVSHVWSALINPGIPIPPELSAVHHIIDEDVAGKPSWDFVLPDFVDDEDDEIVAYAAHNAKFEQQWFTPDVLKKPMICTYRCALRVWANAPSHSNQSLRYWLKLDCDRHVARDVHRAGPDAYVTAHILRELLKHAPVADLIEWSSQPALLPRVTFGKFRGKAWADVERGYLEWIMRQADMGEDVLHTARHHLTARNEGEKP